MSRRIGNIEIEFSQSDRSFHNWWTDFNPSTQVLPKGWQRDPDRLALREDLIWEKDVPIPLRDGVVLRGDIFRPASQDGQQLPALLPWSPYGKTGTGFFNVGGPLFPYIGVRKEHLSGLEKFEAPDPAEWCPRGYALVHVDPRGCYKSEGDIVTLGTQEGKDGYDTIEWIAKQPWSNGAVALVGNSWLAASQWFIAAERPPHLKAIAPWEGIGDVYREHICRGGIVSPHFLEFLMQKFNGENEYEDMVAMIKKYPLMNEYWEDKKPRLSDIEVPMYVLASYSTGLHTEGSIRGWKYASSKDKWLRIHPTQEWHDLYQPASNDDLQRFLDHYLINRDNGWETTPKVRLSLIRYNRPPITFRSEETWPPRRVKYETLHLNTENGSLNPGPVSTSASTSYDSTSWDDDGVHFTHRFKQYTELVGFSKATLYMSCPDLDDMDVYVQLRKLDRDGIPLLNLNIPMEHQAPGTLESDIPDENVYKYVGPNGCLRASKRRVAEEPGLTREMREKKDPTEVWYPHDQEEKIRPGEVVKLEVAIWPGGMVFEEGEALRLEVKGHSSVLPEFPMLRRKLTNLNQGRHFVHTGGEHQSSVMLPLIH